TDGKRFYVAGTYSGRLDFGQGPLPQGNSDDKNFFVAAFDASSGQTLWSSGFGEPHAQDGAFGVAVDPTGHGLVTGVFVDSLDVGGGHVLTNRSQEDIFIAKLDSHGTVVWAQNYGELDNSAHVAHAIASDAAGDMVAAGIFQGTMSFGGPVLTTKPSTIAI